jgi:signal transduction histidine kinase
MAARCPIGSTSCAATDLSANDRELHAGRRTRVCSRQTKRHVWQAGKPDTGAAMTDGTEPAGSERAELETLRRENALLRQTLDAIDATVVVYDADHRFVLANRAYHQFFPHLPAGQTLIGERYESLLERSIHAGTVTDPQAYSDRAGFIARRVRALAEAGAREVYEPHSGHWYLIRVRHTPEGARVALRVDITEQKRLQQALEEARSAAERASLGKSRFLANMSHELRTPLNAVINFARLLVEQIHGPLGAPDYLEYASCIRESGIDLLSVIERLLDFARADAGALALSEQPVNLRGLLDSVLRAHQASAARGGVEVRAAVPADLPSLLGDAARLRQVFGNLLDNAIKYSGAGHAVELAATLEADGDLSVSIADDGPGIAADDLSRMLQPFERADLPRRPGLGLGLPLANHLVRLHGGGLEIASTPGQGTIVRVRLPAGRVLGES